MSCKSKRSLAKRWLAHLGVALVLVAPLVAGCHLLPSPRSPTDTPNLPPEQAPKVPALVNYLNQNAQRVQTVRASVEIDAKQGLKAIGLGGHLACQKPRDFRLRAAVLAEPAVDLGSNDREFWYWIRENNPPYIFHCSYRDLSTGKVNVPFPFQPDMVMAALNMCEYDAKAKYDLKVQKKTLELSQSTTSPTGQPVKRVTVFNRLLARPGEPQVLAHLLLDSRGVLVCRADVQRVTTDRGSGAVIPTRVSIQWPAQKITMKLSLSNVEVNVIDKKQSTLLFQRTALTGTAYDLGRGVVDSPGTAQRATTVPNRRYVDR